MTDVLTTTRAPADAEAAAWNDLMHGDQWRSPAPLWAEDGTEYSGDQVGDLAAAIEAVIRGHDQVRVVYIRSDSKLGCFVGQLAAWRAGCAAVADDGSLGPGELARVRPGLSIAVRTGQVKGVEQLEALASRRTGELPDDIAAVNFTSGSTGRRKAVAVTRGNLLALFTCRDLDVPCEGRLTAGSFAPPGYDGWWFDTWRTVAAGGAVVCLPNVNEDIFEWQELAARYHIDRLLLPAAVLATLVDAVPGSVAGIPYLFSGGEQFQAATVGQARRAGLANQFVNLYGPTEATFATHSYWLPADFDAATIPIGQPVEGCQQTLRPLAGDAADGCELLVGGPLVCSGYLDDGALAHRFQGDDGQPEYRTGDVVRADTTGNLVFAGRLDSRLKVNGIRVDAADLEHQVQELAGVLDCRVVQDEARTVAFVRADSADSAAYSVKPTQIESIIKGFSPAIKLKLVSRFPMKSGGKVDTAALMHHHYPISRDGAK